MRPLEVALLVVLTARLLVALTRREGWTRGLGTFAVVVLLLHVVLEGARWMMAPAYLVMVVVAYWALCPNPEIRGWVRGLGAVVAVLALVVSGALSWILPVPTFSTPDRPVGTTLVAMDGALGQVPVRLFYPSAVSGVMTYAPEAERATFVEKYGLPAWTSSHLRLAALPVAEGVAVDGGPWPVVLFSHGYHVPPSFYGAFLPSLAARGYVVAAITFPGEATMAVFPDGRRVAFDQSRADSLYTPALWERVGALNGEWSAATTDAERMAVFREINGFYPDAEMAQRWAADASAVLDGLPGLEVLRGRIDLDRVGIVGHSAGGGAAAQACREDARFQACANWDGALWGTLADDTLRTPFLEVEAPAPPGAFRPNRLVLQAAQSDSVDGFETLTLLESGHASFSDIPQIVRLAAINEGGTIDPSAAARAVVDVTDAFFQMHLNGTGGGVEAISQSHPFAR
ncbi:hypothetical protein [Rubrivirga sp.]|uniref:alpha/beta hydrolase n=1 Tax=Rubrivirga sp. TaxID=1885344 RepID=UPI003C752E70